MTTLTALDKLIALNTQIAGFVARINKGDKEAYGEGLKALEGAMDSEEVVLEVIENLQNQLDAARGTYASVTRLAEAKAEAQEAVEEAIGSSEPTREEKQAQGRADLAEVFHGNGFHSAAKAVAKFDLDAGPEVLGENAESISMATRGTSLGPLDKVAWAIYYAFVNALAVALFRRLYEAVKNENGVREARGNFFPHWVWPTIEKLISEEDNFINQTLRKDPQLAKVVSAPKGRRADALINHLWRQADRLIETLERREKAAEQVARRARQLERAQASCKKNK